MSLNNGDNPSATLAATANCTGTVIEYTDASSDTTITCTVDNAPTQIANAEMAWTRSPTGSWSCATTGIVAANKDLAPKSCPQS
ncbi:MAG: hypothetical protein MK096_11620 [Oleiphilaceae bacterium]|nr:hypothetical protein [Oleiphilaceae bacterium]